MSDRNELNEGATYALRLILDNDQPTYYAVRELVANELSSAEHRARAVWPDTSVSRVPSDELPDFRERYVRSVVGDVLREWVEGLTEDATRVSNTDAAWMIIRAFVREATTSVAWNELAGAYIDEAREAAEVDACDRCGEDLTHDEGSYAGLCGDCADKDAATEDEDA